jgi:hypothetical protein
VDGKYTSACCLLASAAAKSQRNVRVAAVGGKVLLALLSPPLQVDLDETRAAPTALSVGGKS